MLVHLFRDRHRLVLASIVMALAGPAGAHAMELPRGSLGDAGFTHYVAPVSNPIFNETPYVTTEARPMWLHQEIPGGFLSGGGDIDVIAVQLRAALTDRLGFIATKDGWADIDFHDGLEDENGWANLAFGLKYAVLAQPETNSLVTVAVRYEAPSGDIKTSGIRLQGQGDGLIDLFVSGARTFGPFGFQANVGSQLALDMDQDVSFLHYSLHADYMLMERIVPIIELNGYTPLDDGNRTGVVANGIDLVNMGSNNSKTIVTVAPGMRVRLLDNVDFGIAFEVPVTDAEDLMDWRLTNDFVIHL